MRSFERSGSNVCPKMVEDRVPSGRVLPDAQRVRQGPVGASADEDGRDVFSSDFSVIG